MTFGVDVNWPGSHCRGILSDEHPTSSSGIPVLVYDGQPHRPTDLKPGVIIVATWRPPRIGPVWALIQKAIDAGYPIDLKDV